MKTAIPQPGLILAIDLGKYKSVAYVDRVAEGTCFQRLLGEIGMQIINPRVVKHQVSNYAKKHPHHRGVPSPRKPFLEKVVMLI
jgi:hypothetical protein